MSAETEAARLLGRALTETLGPAGAPGVHRALRTAAFWGSFPRAYTPAHHALGATVLELAPYALDTYADLGRLPAVFTAACRDLLAAADAEGLLS